MSTLNKLKIKKNKRTLPKLSVLRCHAYRVTLCCRRSFVTDRNDHEQNFPYFDPSGLMNNKMYRLHESTYG